MNHLFRFTLQVAHNVNYFIFTRILYEQKLSSYPENNNKKKVTRIFFIFEIDIYNKISDQSIFNLPSIFNHIYHLIFPANFQRINRERISMLTKLSFWSGDVKFLSFFLLISRYQTVSQKLYVTHVNYKMLVDSLQVGPKYQSNHVSNFV